MQVTYNISLYLSTNRSALPLFKAVQSDTGTRQIVASLFDDNGAPYAPGSGVTAEYWSRKPDGTGTSHAATLSGNTVTVTLNTQDLAVPGDVYAAIHLISGNTLLTAMPFVFEVVRNAIGENVTSSDDYETLQAVTKAANEATTAANSAASSANTAASTANTAAKSANTAADEAMKAADLANNAAMSAKYGVSGLLNSSPTLTRLWSSVGLKAAVGTDTVSVTNDFDNKTPFNRRKCVGKWQMVLGKPVFEIYSYYGDDDYAEDGSMGDYVAVECPRAYFKLDGGTLGVSAYQHEGWRPFDIFCRNHNPQDTMPFYYLPAYSLAINEEGHAVSLPGYDNEQGAYASLFNTARTYDGGSLGVNTFLQPAAVNFYEWALFTTEFATNNCQSIMKGCSELRHNGNDRVVFTDSTHIIFQNYSAGRVAGEYIAITPVSVDINSSAYKPTHKIVSIIRSDESGNADSSGAYQYAEVEDLNKNYVEYDISTQYRIAARPYRTGSCAEVLTPSGSPVSNTNGYYPMRYRWRENVYGNQYKTSVDLYNLRVDPGDGKYILEWYYMPDPTKVETPKNFESADLLTDLFIKLSLQTENENYVNGYIKSKKYDKDYPDIYIPDLTTDGSASTFFCDYASLVNSNVVRSVRFGGNWYIGAYAGFSFVLAIYSPSSANAKYGGDLFVQQG